MASEVNYTKQIFRWQQQVLTDAELTPLASRVVMALCGFINSQSHDAWPSHATLAKVVHATRRGVQKALEQLEDRGHLQISVNRGRGQSNRYRPVLAPEIEAERQASENANGSAHFRNEAGQQKCEPACAGVRTPVRTGVRTPVRTNYLKRELSERPSEADVEASVDKERAFEEWWPHYPKRVAKAVARKAYHRVLAKKLATPEELVRGAMRYAAERDGQDEKYTKHPATWLNAECWTDEPPHQGARAEDRTGADAAIARDVIASLSALRRAEIMHETCSPEAVEQAQQVLAAVTATGLAQLEEACKPEIFAAARRAIDELPGLIERQSTRHASRLKDNQKISNPERAESRSEAILRLVEPGLASTAKSRQ